MIDWSRWLPGVKQDEEEDPVSKTLRTLQQGASDVGAGISQGVQDLGTGISSAASSASDALGSAAQTVSSYLPDIGAHMQANRQAVEDANAGQQGGVDFGAGIAASPPGQVYGRAIGDVQAEEDEAARRVREQVTNPVLSSAIAPLEAVRRGVRTATAVVQATPEAITETADAALGAVGAGKDTYGVDTPLGRVGIADAALALAPGRTAQAVMSAGMPIAHGRAGGTDILERGARAVTGAVGSAAEGLGAALGRNAERVGAADARMAAEGATQVPGTLGVITDNPLEAGRAARTRIVPPEVADTLDYPLNPPTDPAIIRAIEAAGGTVDERGATMHLIRNQGPEAAGGTATRGMTYHIAGEPGAPNPYASSGKSSTGGSERIEGPTRYRNPLVISAGDGKGYLDNALEQLGVRGQPDAAALRERQDWITAQRARIDEGARRGNHPDWVREQEGYLERAERLLEDESQAKPVAGRAEIDAQIDALRARTPKDSPERTAGLQEIAARYGGDPSVVPDLVALRPDKTESGYAIIENIIGAHARRAGHDGVLYVGTGTPDFGAINAHPRVVAAERALQEANVAENAAIAEANRIRDAGAKRGEPEYEAAWQRYERAAERSRRALNESHAAQRAAEVELTPRTIEEVADPREKLNPTPGAPNPRVTEARQAFDQAYAEEQRVTEQFNQWHRDWQDANPGADRRAYFKDPEAQRLSEAIGEAQQRADALRQSYQEIRDANPLHVGPPGYTLREDIPRRERSFAELERAYKAAMQRWKTSPTEAAGDAAYAEMESLREPLRDALAKERGTPAAGTAGVLPASARGAGALPAVNRALSEGIAGGVGGAVIEQGRNPDEDPRTAAARGFAVGAVGFPAATRLARGAARLAGAAEREGGGALAAFGTPGAGGAPQPGPGFFARFPGVQGALTAAQQRAASMAARGVQPLGPLQWMRKAAAEVGYSSMIGPTTFTASMLGGPIEAAWTVPKRVLGASLPKGVGGRAAPAEGLTIAQGALRGLGEVGTDIVDALRGQGGNIADALAGRGRYKAVPGHEPLSQQTINPIGHAVTTGLEAGGRFWSGLPDAIYGTIGRRVGEHQAAAEAATSAGLSGSAWKQHVDALLADVENVKAGQSPSMSGTQDVIAAGERAGKHSTYQDELGTYGEAAKKWASIPLIPDGKGGTKPVPVVGNMISPFFNTPWNMEQRLAEKTPILGAVMNTQKGFDKAYDQVVGTALVAGMGTYAASGHITGSGPDDPEKKRMLMATGWRPYSTAIGGYYVPNRVLGEFGPLLNAVGDAHDAMVYSKDQSPAGIAGHFGARFGQQLQQRVWLQGLSELIKALDTGQQGGLGAGAERYAAGLATRMVPYAATARSVLTSEDPWARTTDRGPGTTALGRIGQQVQQGVGLGQGIEAAGVAPLPIQQDVLGRPQANPQRGGRAAFVKVGEDTPDPTIGAFQSTGVDIGAPPSTLTMSKVPGVPITPAERRRWEQARGEYLLDATPSYTNNPDFQSLPPEKQAPYLQSLLGKANAHASSVVQSEMDPEERSRRVTETARKKAS